MTNKDRTSGHKNVNCNENDTVRFTQNKKTLVVSNSSVIEDGNELKGDNIVEAPDCNIQKHRIALATC